MVMQTNKAFGVVVVVVDVIPIDRYLFYYTNVKVNFA